MGIGDGALILADTSSGRSEPSPEPSHSVMIRVDDVDAHHRVARAAGARIVAEPADHAYGERQYTAIDPAGHRWTFTQSIEDIAPEDWGGRTVAPW